MYAAGTRCVTTVRERDDAETRQREKTANNPGGKRNPHRAPNVCGHHR
jgi:hypothetical protein